MKKKRVVVCGEKWVAEQCLEFLYKREDTEICAIVAAPEDWQADLISFGAKRRLKVFVGNINDYLDELKQLQPDVIFSIQYRPLLKPAILNLPTSGCINLHFGLLPRYGGCYPIAWAILNGEKQAGSTLHYMVEQFDEGDIIAQSSVPIREETTARDLFDSMSEAAVKLFIDSYPALLSNAVKSYPQDMSAKLYYPYDSIDFDRDRVIDWAKTGVEIQRKICAFSFDPFQQPLTSLCLPDGKLLQVTVTRSRLHSNVTLSPQEKTGHIKEVTDSGTLLVVTTNGSVIEIGLLNNQTPLKYFEKSGHSPQDAIFK
ncbi:methionyl-tRNA formyltransferase [Candidatus Scalindua japonica]|uniref:Methionyl-tRNA formyltransferase n=1 Tax=Candidatus Scalindua japonica TaxID=1284222 RepID=A0A286TVZ8_9BACT|nr:formyltransferase family protein [Candidatus Scalindua japonica]GAX60001.1 methionyl-tRNA formyltransferase [Candidatus Scalindua japonica]